MELQLHSFGWRVLVALSTTVGLPVTISAAATLAATSDDGNAVADTSLPCAPTRQAAEPLMPFINQHPITESLSLYVHLVMCIQTCVAESSRKPEYEAHLVFEKNAKECFALRTDSLELTHTAGTEPAGPELIWRRQRASRLR